MQDNLFNISIIFINKNFILENSIFPKFCLILFDFIFQKKKSFKIYYSQLTVDRLLFTNYCSVITVHRLQFTDYCRRPKLQYNNCIAIQFLLATYFSSSPLFQHTWLSCNTTLLLALQVTTQYKYCNAIFFHYTPLYCNTIFLLLQYNSNPPSLLRCNTIFPIAIH